VGGNEVSSCGWIGYGKATGDRGYFSHIGGENMKGIIRVDNIETGEYYVATTSDMDKYLATIMRYPTGGLPNRWVAQYGTDAVVIGEVLQTMTDEEYNNAQFRNSKKKQWTYKIVERFGESVVHNYDEAKKEKGKVKLTYDMFSRLEGKLDGIDERLERMEEMIDAKLGK